MKFLWTTLHVKDMEESLNFYREIVGLPLENRFPAGPGMEISFLGNGETKVELICRKDCGEIDLGKDISLGFSVDSLDEKIAFIKEKGLEIHSGPFQPNPSTRCFFVLDPNGLKIQFAEEK
ncbi:MAG: VOC family protein [Bacillota bacterium]